MLRNTLAGLVFLFSIAAEAQTGGAVAIGRCNIANSGNNNSHVTINCGIGREQGKKIIELLNRALASKDIAQINAKLDELIQVAGRPSLEQTCISGNCAGTNNGSQSINYSTPHPPPRITFTQKQLDPVANPNAMQKSMNPGIEHPGVEVTITLGEVFFNPAFIIKCTVPCAYSTGIVNGASSTQALNSPGDPTIAGVAFTLPSQMYAGTVVTIVLRSEDERPVTALVVQPYIPPGR